MQVLSRNPRANLGRRVLHALVPAILEQKVTGTEAYRAYRGIVRHFGEPAPGPVELTLPPDPRATTTRLARVSLGA